MFIIVTVRIIIPILFRSITRIGRKREISLDKRLSGGVVSGRARWRDSAAARWWGHRVRVHVYKTHIYVYGQS